MRAEQLTQAVVYTKPFPAFLPLPSIIFLQIITQSQQREAKTLPRI
jgi:hypothetical protein